MSFSHALNAPGESQRNGRQQDFGNVCDKKAEKNTKASKKDNPERATPKRRKTIPRLAVRAEMA
jgi:hypothetical protein